jgi:hypothetical protein
MPRKNKKTAATTNLKYTKKKPGPKPKKVGLSSEAPKPPVHDLLVPVFVYKFLPTGPNSYVGAVYTTKISELKHFTGFTELREALGLLMGDEVWKRLKEGKKVEVTVLLETPE